MTKILNKITLKITCFIEENGNINDTDALDRINYSLQAILGDLLKCIILLCIFLYLGKIQYFLFSTIILFSTRIFLGGYHCKTFMNCLFSSLIFFVITSFLAPKMPKLNNIFYYLISSINILTTIFYAPFPNIKRPIRNKKRRKILKLISIFSLLSLTYLLCFKFNDISYINCGLFTITLETIQIFLIIKGGLNYEKTL